MPTASTKLISNYAPPTEADLIDTFEQNNRSYQLFKEKGLDKDIAGVDEEYPYQPISSIEKILNKKLFKRARAFLAEVDLSKGPIQRRVIKLERRKDLDPNTHKVQEHLVVHVEWIAKNHLGNELVSVEMLEGMYNNPVVQTTLVKGKAVKKYQNWQPVYDIPFTPEAVNTALQNQINPPELVKYMVRTSQSDRDDSFSLEQFRDSTFEQCVEIHKQGKGLNR